MKSIALLAIGFCLLPTLGTAQTSQFDAVLAPVGWGAGPQAFGVAPGRSFANIYGSVDLAANWTNAAGKSTVRLQSGNDWTSKLGFYGQEDLGDQWSAFFRLESGFYANTGATQDSTSFFNRGSFVGIQQPRFGQLTFGRQYTSMGSAVLGVDPFLVTAHDSVAAYLLTASELTAGANADTLSRANNTVRYVMPRSAWGLGADLSYSLKSDQSTGPATHARTASFTYVDRSVIATLAFGQSWCDPAISTCTAKGVSTAAVRTDVGMASVFYDLGPFVAQAGYLRFAPKADGAGKADLILLGAQRMSDLDLYRLSVGYRTTSVSEDHAYGFTAGVDHYLSKRTALYARVGMLRNGDRSSLSYNYDSTGGGTLLTAGQSARDVSVGISHSF